jgi:hypothetical protein
MEKQNTKLIYNVFNFKLITVFDDKEIIELLESNLKGIHFEYLSNQGFLNKKYIILDLYYYMSDNFLKMKKIVKKGSLKQHHLIKVIAANEGNRIALYKLKIKDIMFFGLSPTKLDYNEVGRMCYRLKIKCEELND